MLSGIQSIVNEKMNTIEACEKQINDTSNLLFGLAALNIIIFSLLGVFTKSFLPMLITLLPDCIFLVVIGFLYKKYKSRSISIILLLYSILICFTTFANKFGGENELSSTGGTNIFLAIILLFTAFKSVQASFSYSKLKNYSIRWKHWFIKTFVYLITFAFWFFILMILCVIFPNMSDSLSGGLVFTVLFLPMYLIYSGWFPWGSKLKIKYIKNAENVK